MRGFKSIAVVAVMMVSTAATAAAQQWGAWGGQAYAGYAVPMSEGLKNYTNGGFSWGAGLRYSPEDAIWGIRFDIRNSHLGGDEAAIRKTLDSLGVEEAYKKDGFFRTWDFALAGELGTSKDNRLRAYVLGGVNFSNKYSAITEPTLVGGCWWDPIWGYICGSGSADVILAKRNKWEFGWNAGGGVSVDMGRGASLFIEAVYTNVAGSNVDTDNGTRKSASVGYLPIYFGVRF